MSASEIKQWLQERKRIREAVTASEDVYFNTDDEVSARGAYEDMAEAYDAYDEDVTNSQEKFERVIEVLLGAVEKLGEPIADMNEHFIQRRVSREALAKAAEILGEA